MVAEFKLMLAKSCSFSVSESVIDSFRLEIAIASTELASLFRSKSKTDLIISQVKIARLTIYLRSFSRSARQQQLFIEYSLTIYRLCIDYLLTIY